MQNDLEVVKSLLVYLVNNNILKTYEIIEPEHRLTDDFVIIKVNGLDLGINNAIWYLQGMIDANNKLKLNTTALQDKYNCPKNIPLYNDF